MALAAYRHLLRATRIAFEGDHHLLHAARSQAREGFDKARSLDTGSEEAVKSIGHAEGVADVLKHNVVQGKQLGAKEDFKLRIHEHTERGDNDTIKNPKGKGGVVKIGGA